MPKEIAKQVGYDLMANSQVSQGGISGTGGISGAWATPPGLCIFRFSRWRSRCSCSAWTVAKICSCCAMKSVVFALRAHISLQMPGNGT